MTILGISIGTTETGVCVLQDGVMVDRQVHTYYTIWSDMKVRIIINRYRQYIHKRNVQAVIIKIPPLRKHTKPVTLLIRRIEALAKQYNCDFDLITKSEIKHVLCLRSARELNDYARRLYPELEHVYEKGLVNGQHYYKKMFEAVLSAHIYQERQRVRLSQERKT